MDAIDFWPSAKNKTAAIELLKYMLWTTLVNAISLKSFHQSTSNLNYDVLSPKRRTLLILGHRTFKIYVLLKVVYACERNIFKTISQIDFKLEICFYNV